MKSSYSARYGKPRRRHFRKSTGPAATRRRKVALSNLVKSLANLEKHAEVYPMSIDRIKREIKTLESRIS